MTEPRLPEPGSLAEQVRMLCAEQLTRRRFLIGAGAASVLAVAACRPVAAPTPGPKPTPGPPSSVSSRVLVVLEMAGGHDGYSMFIPYKNPTYYQLRPTVSVPAAQVIPIAGQSSGLHPNLVKLQHRNLAFVDGVGPSHPNDSHFDMIKRWWEADTDGAHQSVSGFFGRLCDAAADPNAAAAGLCIAWRTTPALVANTSTTLSIPPDSDAQYPAPWDPTLANSWMTAQRAMAVAGSGAPPADKSARSGITTAIKFADATVHMPGPSAVYPNTGLGQQLSLAARLIRTQIGLKVIYLPWDGPFDSHSDHRGNHDPLMTELDNALDMFLGDMQANGLNQFAKYFYPQVRKKALIIDVRSKEAFLAHHVAGALAMPLDELRAMVTAEKKAIALDRPIVIYCGDGARSGPEGTYVMNQAGYAGAVNLKGGLEGWQKAGLPMATGA